jgi:hypothetical protein
MHGMAGQGHLLMQGKPRFLSKKMDHVDELDGGKDEGKPQYLFRERFKELKINGDGNWNINHLNNQMITYLIMHW